MRIWLNGALQDDEAVGLATRSWADHRRRGVRDDQDRRRATVRGHASIWTGWSGPRSDSACRSPRSRWSRKASLRW